jgi:hypothetical protein
MKQSSAVDKRGVLPLFIRASSQPLGFNSARPMKKSLVKYSFSWRKVSISASKLKTAPVKIGG